MFWAHALAVESAACFKVDSLDSTDSLTKVEIRHLLHKVGNAMRALYENIARKEESSASEIEVYQEGQYDTFSETIGTLMVLSRFNEWVTGNTGLDTGDDRTCKSCTSTDLHAAHHPLYNRQYYWQGKSKEEAFDLSLKQGWKIEVFLACCVEDPLPLLQHVLGKGPSGSDGSNVCSCNRK